MPTKDELVSGLLRAVIDAGKAELDRLQVRRMELAKESVANEEAILQQQRDLALMTEIERRFCGVRNEQT